MFQASSCPSSGATTTAVAASGLPIVIRDTVFKRQVINLRSCYILLVDSVPSMTMKGRANPKFINANRQVIYTHIETLSGNNTRQ
jgi:hypothetical protein